MRLQAANRDESPTALLAQFKIIQQQTLQTEDGQSLNEITEINPAQKPLFNAPELKAPTPNNLLTSSL
jgi:ABC-type cobalt transport system substrate-binding protein